MKPEPAKQFPEFSTRSTDEDDIFTDQEIQRATKVV